MDEIWQILTVLGIPASLIGLAFWYIKKRIEQKEKERDERDKNLESLVLMMLQSTRANTILCVATAEAVRDGHCNGNMSSALAAVEKVAQEEKKFLLDKSIKYIFE